MRRKPSGPALLPVFGHVLVGSIKARHVSPLAARTARQRRETGDCQLELERHEGRLNFGEAKELIEQNPIRRGAVKLLRADNMRMAFFEPEEWEGIRCIRRPRALATAPGPSTREGRPSADNSRPESRRRPAAAQFRRLGRLPRTAQSACPVFRALLSAGSRLGEILILTRGAVDLKSELVTIHQHKTGTTKSLICAPLRALLQPLAPGVWNALVFRKADGSGFYPMEIPRAFAVAVKLWGANPALSVHSIRHTVGSLLSIAGHPEWHIAEMLNTRSSDHTTLRAPRQGLAQPCAR